MGNQKDDEGLVLGAETKQYTNEYLHIRCFIRAGQTESSCMREITRYQHVSTLSFEF